MDDLISRKQAIDTLDKCHCGGRDENGNPWIYKENAVEAIEMVEPSPSAQPKRGKWIEIEAFDDSRYVKCDQCKTVQVFYYGKRNTNFCPNCGAKMGDEDE